ncbi:MAG: hypothetical protein WBM28_01805 [Burkholderiales bacterium]
MIRDDQDLTRANAALGDLYRALAALRREYAETHAPTFTLLAEGPLQEIARIQADIDVYSGASLAAHDQAPLWIRLVGPKARWGEMPASIVTAFLDALRKGVQSIAGFRTSERRAGRPSAELQLACDFEVSLFLPGSFEVGVRLPEPDQREFFPTEFRVVAEAALQEFLVAAEWAGRPNPQLEQLETAIPEAQSRRVALRAIKPFVPRRQGGVDFVDLYGSATARSGRIHLAPGAADSIAKALTESIDESEEVVEGDIREMDLDKRTFRLRNVAEVGEVHCRFGDDLLATASELLGKRVRVIGTRRSTSRGTKGALSVTDLEKLETRRAKN